MKSVITVFRNEEGMVIADCPAIPGRVSQGKTEEETEQSIREAIRACLKSPSEKGVPLTASTRRVEVAV